MENVSCFGGHEEEMELPPGFRFHPTDEELISHYLSPKVLDCSFCAIAIGEVDLNKVEPWDLPWKAKFGEKEWYFFCLRDRKYPTGQRTNRATDAGYWKATGKDRDIFKSKALVGMKKTLVFYKGRAPKGEKTNWVMHEYRLEGKYSMHNLPKTAKNEWVICRVFNKSLGGKKMHISGLIRSDNMSSNLPPLIDISLHDSSITTTTTSNSHVTCFSDSVEEHKPHHPLFSCPTPSKKSVSMPYIENFQYADSGLIQEHSIQRHYMIENNGLETKQNYELGMRDYNDNEFSINSAGPVDLDCLWNY